MGGNSVGLIIRSPFFSHHGLNCIRTGNSEKEDGALLKGGGGETVPFCGKPSPPPKTDEVEALEKEKNSHEPAQGGDDETIGIHV